MKKKWYQSKTIIGFGIFILIGFLEKAGYVDTSTIIELAKSIGGGLGMYGARDALGK